VGVLWAAMRGVIMIAMPMEKNPEDSRHREVDDLTVIKGISGKRQAWFRKTFNVRTYGELAALSADEIESRLKADGQIVSRDQIKGWITKDQELAAAANLSSRLTGTSANAETKRKTNSPTPEGEWEMFAVFIVEFRAPKIQGSTEERRIEISYMPVKHGEWQEGERTKPIPVEGETLYQWMRNQLAKRVPEVPEPSEEKRPVEAPPTPALPVRVELIRVRAFQPPQTKTPVDIGKAGQQFSGSVRSGQPFALEVSFELMGLGAADAVERRVAYSAQFHICNLDTQERTYLGDTKAEPLEKGKAHHTALLPNAYLQPGVYRLWTLITLQSTPPYAGCLEVPLLQVV
jgi:hypothetical protein